jgi:hypothetical protein
MVTVSLSHGWSDSGVALTTHPSKSRAEVKERIDLYLYSLYGPSWPVLGRTLSLRVPCRRSWYSEMWRWLYRITYAERLKWLHKLCPWDYMVYSTKQSNWTDSSLLPQSGEFWANWNTTEITLFVLLYVVKSLTSILKRSSSFPHLHRVSSSKHLCFYRSGKTPVQLQRLMLDFFPLINRQKDILFKFYKNSILMKLLNCAVCSVYRQV